MQHFYLTIILRNFLVSILFLLLFFPEILLAEGTKAIAPSTNDEAALFIGAGNTGTRGGDYGLFAWKDSDSKLYFNIQNSCEKVFMGFSIPKNDRSFADVNPVYGGSGIDENLIFRIVDPLGNPINNLACFGNTTINGEVWQTLNSNTANITNRVEADNGPSQLGNAVGYNGFELDLSACGLNLTGNYSIEFYTTNGNYDPNTARSGFYIPYFDITVADCTNQGMTGRVWSNNWGIGIKRDGQGSFDRAFNGTLFVCSTEGFITKLDFNTNTNTRAAAGRQNDQQSGFRAGSFNISFNRQGPGISGDIIADRQSLPNVNSPNPELPVFLNLPDQAFCPVQELGEIKAAANFVTGCPQDRCINVAATQPGQFEIIIEGANGNGILDQASERRVIYQITDADKVANPETAGFIYEACIPWDGKDGNGNALLEVAITVTGSYFQGIYHFPVYDAEFNDDGFIVETVRPALGRQLLYYDDTKITEVGGTTESKDGTNGCTGPCHRWTGEWENYADKDDNFGNYNTINTWWFASTTAQDFTNNVGGLSPLAIVCPADFVGCTSQSTDPSVTGRATIEPDLNCTFVLDYTDEIITNNCDEKIIQRTWFAYLTDLPNERKTCTQLITLKAPILTNCPNNIVLSCADGNTYAWNPPTIEGVCGGTIRQTSGPVSGSVFAVGTTTISYEIEGACGASQTCSFTVTVNGANPDDLTIICPTVPADVRDCTDQSSDPSVTGTAIVVNNSSCPTTLNYTDNVTDDGCGGKTIKREWVVYYTDNPTIRKTCSQTIIIAAPTLTNCPSNVVLGCADGNIPTWTAPTINGGCSGTVIQTSGPASGSAFPVGTTTITYQIGGGCANQTCSFTVTINGSGSPDDLTIICPTVPADVRDCTDQSTDPSVTGTATVVNNSSCPTTLTYTDNVTDDGCGGKTIKREWVVYYTDNPTIRKTCSQVITIAAPTLTNCPSNVVLGCADGNIHTWTAPMINGGCSGTVIQTSGSASGSVFPVGITTITYQIGGGCANQTCSFTVTVTEEGGGLTVACPADIVLDCEDGQNGAHYSWETPTATSCCNSCPEPGLDLADFVYMGTLNGHQYYCSKEKATWLTAKAICESQGGHLAVINSIEENQMLSSFLTEQSAYIGFNDFEQEGNFKWCNNNPVTYSNWYPNQPDNFEGNQDVTRLLSNGVWDDINHLYKLEYILEIPCLTVQQCEGPESGSVFPVGTTEVAYHIEDACGNEEICRFNVTVNACPDVLDYCDITGRNTTYFWIRHVVCGDINNATGTNGGYADFSNLSTNMNAGSEQTIILSPGFAHNKYYLNWNVWIDYNRDGDFNDSGEKVFTYRDYNILKIRFRVPQECEIGQTRMRVAMKYSNSANSCEDFTYGEVEDYTINLLPATDNLSAMTATSRSDNKVEVEIIPSESTAPLKNSLPTEMATLTMFPNPVSDNLQVQLADYQQLDGTLRIYNNLGQIVHQAPLTTDKEQQFSIAVNHLPDGMYLLSIESEFESPIVKKFNKH